MLFSLVFFDYISTVAFTLTDMEQVISSLKKDPNIVFSRAGFGSYFTLLREYIMWVCVQS